MSATVDRTALRRAIREYIKNNDAPTYSEIVTAVAVATEADPTDVGRELDDFERVGVVYLVSTSLARTPSPPSKARCGPACGTTTTCRRSAS